MKTILTILAVLFFGTAFGQKFTPRLTGTWEAVGSDNHGIGLIVKDSSEIYLVNGTERKRLAGYKADFSRSPSWFDFMVKDGEEVTHLKSLIQFVNDDLIQWQLFDSAERPAYFTEKEGEILYLRRKK